MDLPDKKTLAAALALVTVLGTDKSKGTEILTAIREATVKNSKILEQAQLKLAKASDLVAREAAVAEREIKADAAIKELAEIRAAYRSYERDLKAKTL